MYEINNQKNRKINVLVPKLLEQSNKYKKTIQNRLKIDTIYTELEAKASREFNFFVKESINRYKGLKIGNNLDNLLSTSKRRCQKEARKILTDNFYINKELQKEKEEMKKKRAEKLYNKLRNTFDKIKKTEVNKADYLKEVISKINNKQKEDFSDELNNGKNLSFNEKFEKDSKALKITFNKDNKKVQTMFANYRGKLDNICNKSGEERRGLHKKLNIDLPKLSLINYIKYQPIKKKEVDEVEFQKAILRKILPFSKCCKNNNANTSAIIYKEKNKIKPNKRGKSLNDEAPKNQCSFMTQSFGKKKLGMFSRTQTTDYVLDSANKEFKSQNIFNKKRNKMENILGMSEIPKLDEYENIIKTYYNEIKAKRNQKSEKLYQKQRFASLTHYEKMNEKIDDEIYLLTKIEDNLYKNKNNSKNPTYQFS